MARRRRKLPRRGARGRFIKAASNPRRRRRTYYAARPRRRSIRRNAYFANPRRRYGRRRARRNPPLFAGNRILGMSFNEILYAGGGFIAPPLIEGMLSNVLPDALKTSQIGKYAVKGGIVAGLSMLGGKFLGREAGKYIAIGGITYLVAQVIVDFAPQLFSGFGATSYNPGRVLPTMRGSALLGAYMGGPGNTPTSLIGIPDRLQPSARI